MKKLIKKLLSKTALDKLRRMYFRVFGHNKLNIRKGNSVELAGALIRNCTINVRGKNNRIVIGKGNSLINCNIEIFGDDCVLTIDENNIFKDSTFWLEDTNSAIVIGSNNHFCGKIHIGVVEGTSVTIGNDCLFSSEIYITTTDSHSIIDKSTNKRINPSCDVLLGNHIWIGHKATVLKGVNIADNTIVGASAMLTHSVEEQYTIVAGNPARTVRRNVSWDEYRI